MTATQTVTTPMPAKTRRTQAERSETTKADLIAAAIDCINEYGYAGATTHRIANRAKVTRGALNHHFKDRTDLMLAVCNTMGDDFVAGLRKEMRKTDPAPKRLRTFAHTAWAAGVEPAHRAYLEIMMATKNDPDLKRMVSDSLQKIDAQSLAIWLDAFSDLPVPKDVLTKLRNQLFYIQRGMSILHPFLKNDGHFEEQIDLFCEMAAQKIDIYVEAVAGASRGAQTPRDRRRAGGN